MAGHSGTRRTVLIAGAANLFVAAIKLVADELVEAALLRAPDEPPARKIPAARAAAACSTPPATGLRARSGHRGKMATGHTRRRK